MIFTIEAILADGYAAGLLAIAAGLDRLARHVAVRPGHHPIGGLPCRPEHDARENVRTPPPWPHSEAGRFHRCLALVLVVLAASLTLVQAIRHPARPDLVLAAGTLAATGLTGWLLARRLRATPAGFPGPGREHEQPASPERTKDLGDSFS
ncbi:hypothetical protein AAH991_31135 [Microbispora sp. ZYX-F-249]|uniref:Uncharacterized protein n=1 Tax=Microbispora maris TaxID=3144104 RepID=A0ABV0AWF1_9ACTN